MCMQIAGKVLKLMSKNMKASEKMFFCLMSSEKYFYKLPSVV